MAQIAFRLNVTASQFPFLSDQEGATVIVPGNDTYYVRPNSFTGETADKNLGIPQFTFCENVMPTTFGVSSVGFIPNTMEFPGGVDKADQLIYLRGITGRRYLMNFNRITGEGYIYSPEISAWIQVFAISELLSQAYVCLVKGRCFIAFKNHNAMFEFKGFNTTTSTFEFLVFTDFGGIDDLTPIFGIVSANNYFILFTRTEIFYTIPEEGYGGTIDFTPSLGPTGAAVETPTVLKGVILTCLPTQDGFFLFTSTNIVAAFYSGNIKFPWTYRELENSAAINDLDQIAFDRDGYPKYVYTSAGILKINKSSCSNAFVEASEFIGNAIYEVFNWTTKLIQRVNLTAPLRTSFAYVANRWLVISYGEIDQPFKFALIWDEHLKRWGKVQIDHSRATEFFGISATLSSLPVITYGDLLNVGWTYQYLLDNNITYRMLGGVDYQGNPDFALEYKSLGFISPNGIMNVVNFDMTNLLDRSVAILGRIQFTRNSRFKVNSLFVENLNTNPITGIIKVACLSSNLGKVINKTEYGWLAKSEGDYKSYHFAHAEGTNHQLRFEGDFDLSTIIVSGARTGRAFS